MIELIDITVDTIGALEKWQGHLLNWYDTLTLKPLNGYIYADVIDLPKYYQETAAITERRAVVFKKFDQDDYGDALRSWPKCKQPCMLPWSRFRILSIGITDLLKQIDT